MDFDHCQINLVSSKSGWMDAKWTSSQLLQTLSLYKEARQLAPNESMKKEEDSEKKLNAKKILDVPRLSFLANNPVDGGIANHSNVIHNILAKQLQMFKNFPCTAYQSAS